MNLLESIVVWIFGGGFPGKLHETWFALARHGLCARAVPCKIKRRFLDLVCFEKSPTGQDPSLNRSKSRLFCGLPTQESRRTRVAHCRKTEPFQGFTIFCR